MKRLLSLSLVLLLIIMSMPLATFAVSSLGVSIDEATQNSATATISGAITGSTLSATLSPNDGTTVVTGNSVNMTGLTANKSYLLTITETYNEESGQVYQVRRAGNSDNYFAQTSNNGEVKVDGNDVYHYDGNVKTMGWNSQKVNFVFLSTTIEKSNIASINFTTLPMTYNLTINTVGNGSVSRDIDGPYTAGTVVELTATPAENNHFTGWSNNLGTDPVVSVTVNGDMTVTANFAIDQHQVRFMDSESVHDSKMVNHGDVVSLPSAPTKDHQVFNGWFIGEVPFDPNTPITAPLDIEAAWLPVNMYFTVDNIIEIYHNGSLLTPVYTPPTSQFDWQKIKYYYANLQEGDVIAVKGTDEGVVAGMIGQILFNGVHPTQTDSHWRYSINLQDGWNNKGFTMDESWNEVFEPTYNWSGLVGVPSGFNAKWIWSPNFETPNNGDTVVYFRYVIGGYQQPDPEPTEVTITFDSDGGSTVNPITINEGTSLNSNEIALPIPSKDGHTFVRWSYGEDSTFDGATVVDGDLTVVAIYTVNTNNDNQDDDQDEDTQQPPVTENTPVVIFTPIVEEIEEEETPLGAAKEIEFFNVDSLYEAPVRETEETDLGDEIILDEATPLADALPKTGQLPPQAFVGIGSLITAVGAFMKRKNR